MTLMYTVMLVTRNNLAHLHYMPVCETNHINNEF